MAMRLCIVFALACLVASEAPLPDPVIEFVTVNGNRVSQKLRDLQNGTANPGHRVSVEYAPMDCKVEKYPGYKFTGTLSTSGNWFDTEDICASVCWQLSSQGWPCASSNYIQQKKTCELMQDKYGDSNTGLTNDATSTYLHQINCKKPGQPQQTTTQRPTTQQTQPPQPQPGGSGTTNNIRPGSCGQASVPQRINRSYLANKSPFTRIVGGNEANKNSIPFIVSLRSWNWHFCGGTLIRVNEKDESDIAITASHCISDENNPTFEVVAGAHYKEREIPGEQRAKAVRVVKHPQYNKPGSNIHDIAIIKLDKPIKFSNTVQPACLPGRFERVQDGINGIVAGWGALQEGQAGPDALYQVTVPSISHAKCLGMYGNVYENASLCGGYDQGQKDSCQGDSGGPYFFEGKNGWTLQGVVSWGSGCARPRAPGVYARVSSYVDFIQEQIKALTAIKG